MQNIYDKNNLNVEEEPQFSQDLKCGKQQQWLGGWAEGSLGVIKSIVLVCMSQRPCTALSAQVAAFME